MDAAPLLCVASQPRARRFGVREPRWMSDTVLPVVKRCADDR